VRSPIHRKWAEQRQQRLVGGEEVGLAQLRHLVGADPARGHEVERLLDARGQLLVARALGAAGDELQVPAMHLVQVREAALGKGTQQVQGGRRLVVGAQQAFGIGYARRGVELDAVDDVAAIARQLDPVLDFCGRRARLGELAGHAADLDHRTGRAEGQHHGHLQQHAKGVANVVRVELGEALGTVAALQQKGLALGHGAELLLEAPGLAGEDQRRKLGETRFDPVERLLVRIVRHLLDRLAAPAVRRPLGRHFGPRSLLFHPMSRGDRVVPVPARVFHRKRSARPGVNTEATDHG
jgi:hypothetical protein